jgi:prevent-host-death family protein
VGTVTIQEAQARLPDLIRRLAPGDEVLITDNSQPVAKLVSQAPAARKRRQRGSAKGRLVVRVEDDEHLEHFKEYMP